MALGADLIHPLQQAQEEKQDLARPALSETVQGAAKTACAELLAWEYGGR